MPLMTTKRSVSCPKLYSILKFIRFFSSLGYNHFYAE